jgi:hypothetical protein
MTGFEDVPALKSMISTVLVALELGVGEPPTRMIFPLSVDVF